MTADSIDEARRQASLARALRKLLDDEDMACGFMLAITREAHVFTVVIKPPEVEGELPSMMLRSAVEQLKKADLKGARSRRRRSDLD